MLSALVLSAVIVISSPLASSTIPRVRPLSDTARQLVDDAARRSPTIARLLRTIEASDVVVYVDLKFNLRSQGATTLMSVNGRGRFVHVAIGTALSAYRRIEILGHELQHAVEIVQARDVRDASSFRRLYSRIGWLLSDSRFESGEAIDVERQVRQDLRLGAAAQTRKQQASHKEFLPSAFCPVVP